ncbi:hypothetical protein [uncultured Aureimonas sp.]|uniref:hypothetical protein n=1 Tax=uncultured Aureimonas sp. TaxID=1604662 RepID=UPI0025E54FF6|nr:hypothetical protein [uncultured Aureimonas sp.]
MRLAWVALVMVAGTIHAQAQDSKINNGSDAQESVLYCVEESANGFDAEGSTYSRSTFASGKFTLQFTEAGAIVNQRGTKEYYGCNVSPFNGDVITCSDRNGYYFTANRNTGRFIKNQSFGFVNGQNDSVRTSIGNCSKF